MIERRYPAHAIIGEEHGTKEGRDYRWVLDPIDGTRAFITNCFLFGTLIALERWERVGYRPILGAIGHPAASVALIGHQRARCSMQATARHDALRCAVHRLADATVLVTSHWTSGEQSIANTAHIEAVVKQAKLYRTWGDCFGYFAVATGAADLMLDPQLGYWDIAAIVPVIEGAGGVVTSWSGGDPLIEPSLIASAGALASDRAVAAFRLASAHGQYDNIA